jgi:hypothetical protein
MSELVGEGVLCSWKGWRTRQSTASKTIIMRELMSLPEWSPTLSLQQQVETPYTVEVRSILLSTSTVTRRCPNMTFLPGETVSRKKISCISIVKCVRLQHMEET